MDINKIAKDVRHDFRQGENIDLYITVAVALVLVMLNLIGIGQSMTSSLTLAVLALLAISSLVSRRKLDDTVEKIDRDRNVLLAHFPASREIDVEGAKELWLIGLTLSKTIESYYAKLGEKLKQGDRIRVLIVSPDSHYSELIAKRKFSPITTQRVRDNQKASLELLCYLKRDYERNIEIRTMKYPAFLGIVAADLESIEGVIYVEHYSYRMNPEDLPKLVFRQSDGKWFEYYRQQIKNMWNDSEDWNCL
jgi:hypothetical protein